jgi:flavodoxin I
MASTGLFFASTTGNCQTIARIISDHFLPHTVEIHDVMHTPGSSIEKYNNLIFGIPTWHKLDMHEDWQDFLPYIRVSSLQGKKLAIYGSADQHTYPDNFADGIGLLYHWLAGHKTQIVGSWPSGGYTFRRSQALVNGNFVGLVLDEDFQSDLTTIRVRQWVEQLKTEFEI